MCTIEKMLIKGIRSFSPDNEVVIEFFKPLTLIVGANGAGKTTIIECLKQACTGELPPNTRSGQSFIHDPKVAHEPEVKAQIKLRFNTSTGQPVVVVRSFQLTQKKATMTFKTLDSTLQTINKDTGQKQALTYRCADIDKLVPSLMGVSKAVLENVIFVHQEESNWPLSEGKVLKDKFDDIFSATKYTKALEVLRKLKSEKAAEIKLMKEELNSLRAYRNQALKLKKEAAEGQERAYSLEAQIAELEQGIQAKSESMLAIEEKLRLISGLMQGSEAGRARLEMLERQTQEKFTRLQEGDLLESDSELEAHLNSFNQFVQELTLKMDQLKGKAGNSRIEKEALNERYQRECMAHGRMTAEANAHAESCRDLLSFMAHCSAILGIPLPNQIQHASLSAASQHNSSRLTQHALMGLNPSSSIDLTDRGGGGAGGQLGGVSSSALVSAAQSFLRQVEARRVEVEGQVRDTKGSFRAREASIGESIDRANALAQRSLEGARLKREQVARNEAEMARVEGEASFLVVNTNAVREAQENVEDLTQRLSSKQAELNQSSFEQDAAREKQAIEETARRIGELRQERERLAAASDSAVRMRLRRQELSTKEEELAKFIARWRPRLLGLLGLSHGQDLPSESLIREEAERALGRKRSLLATKTREVQEARAAHASAAGTLGGSRAQLSAIEAQLAPLKATVREGMTRASLIGGGAQVASASLFDVSSEEAALASYPPCVHQTKVTFEGKSTQVYNANAILMVYNKNKEDIVNENECPTCKRGFKNEEEKRRVVRAVELDIEQLPARVEAARLELELHKKRLEILENLSAPHARLLDLTLQLPHLSNRVAMEEGKVKELDAKIATLADEHQAMELEVSEASKVSQEAAWQVDRQWREVDELRKQLGLSSSSTTLDPFGLGPTQHGGAGPRTVREVDEALEREEGVKGEHERRREDLMRRQTRLKDEVLSLTSELGLARAQATRVGESFARRTEAESRLRELSLQNQVLSREAEDLTREQVPKVQERDRLLAERDALRAQASEREREDEERLREVQKMGDQLGSKVRPVLEYESGGKASQLEKVDGNLRELQSRMDGIQSEVTRLEQEVAHYTKTINDREGLLRQTRDVMDYRRSKRELEAQRSEVEVMRARASEQGDRVALSRELSALTGERDEARRRQDVMRGQLQATLVGVQKSTLELSSSSDFSNIEHRYNERRLMVKTSEMALDDLDKYHRALEKALLTYHTSKMSDINKVIKELWQKTYRGQDIDYIQVKADTEGVGARSYNYRVAMYSGGAELEMRGRCSTGQKVLACLIIRLALAETFCLNCGILALDEPTTNLDSENSASLAEALKAIMTSRKDQDNFQLVVITHDEKFAHLIGTRDKIDYMWRITKDEDQHTKISCETVE